MHHVLPDVVPARRRPPRCRGHLDAADRAAQVWAVPRTLIERAVKHFQQQLDFGSEHDNLRRVPCFRGPCRGQSGVQDHRESMRPLQAAHAFAVVTQGFLSLQTRGESMAPATMRLLLLTIQIMLLLKG